MSLYNSLVSVFLFFENREIINVTPAISSTIFSISFDNENLFSGVDDDLGEFVFVSGELSCSDIGFSYLL